VNHVIITVLPQLANAHIVANTSAGQTISALGTDILSNGKAMALGSVGLLGVLTIVLGTLHMISRIKSGIGESIMFQLGVIALGVIVVCSVGVAAAMTDWAVDQGVVDRRYVHNEWGR
jgi:hypothetical protein